MTNRRSEGFGGGIECYHAYPLWAWYHSEVTEAREDAEWIQLPCVTSVSF